MRVARPAIISLAVSALFALTACDAPQQTRTPSNNGPQAADGDRQSAKMAFLHRVREADPSRQTIERAFLNDQNELAIILDPSVEMDSNPALMKTLLARMATTFPGEDLTIIAYTPSAPPLKIGTSRLNAQTRDVTYTPVR